MRHVTKRMYKTPYQSAWQKFTESDEFQQLLHNAPLAYSDETESYLINRIRAAFDMGWRSRVSVKRLGRPPVASLITKPLPKDKRERKAYLNELFEKDWERRGEKAV